MREGQLKGQMHKTNDVTRWVVTNCLKLPFFFFFFFGNLEAVCKRKKEKVTHNPKLF